MTRLAVSLILRDLLNFRDYKLCSADLVEDVVTATLGSRRKTGRCPACGRRSRNVECSFTRRVRDLDAFDCKCYLQFPERKIHCKCGYREVEKLEFADPYSRCTKRFEEYVFRLCKYMTVLDVAELLGLSWLTVKKIDKKYLSQLNVGLENLNPTRIGVDEVAYQRGYNYLTVVRDIDLGKVIWIGFSRTKETLDSFFKELGLLKSYAVKVVVLDMWDPYISSVREYTNADIVFDKFHIAKKVNEAVDTVRKQEFAKADPVERKEMKHKRFLILSRSKNLPEEKRHELKQLMQQNETLYQTYLLKEQALDIFDETNAETALIRLMEWVNNTMTSGITAFDNVIKTMMDYLYGYSTTSNTTSPTQPAKDSTIRYR